MNDPHGPVFIADRDLSDGLEIRCFRLDQVADVAKALYYTTKVLNELKRARLPG